MLDFNDTHTPVPRDLDAEREAIRAELLARVESVLAALFPAGRKRGGKSRRSRSDNRNVIIGHFILPPCFRQKG